VADGTASVSRSLLSHSRAPNSNLNIQDQTAGGSHFAKTARTSAQKTGMLKTAQRSQYSQRAVKPKKNDEPAEDVKFSAMKTTKQIKARHEGLLKEIAKEVS
jgi:hypothetical protein